MDGDGRQDGDAHASEDDRSELSDRDEVGREQSLSAASRPDGQASPSHRRKLPFVLFGVVLLVAAVGGTLYWLDARNYESTDDAIIDGMVAQVTPQVSGRVVRLLVSDNQLVEAGQPLVELDPRDYQVKLDQAKAKLGNAAAGLEQARAQAGQAQANIDQAKANVRVAEADLYQAQRDYQRFHAINPQAISRQQLDSANAAARSAQAKLDASRQVVVGADAQARAAGAQVLAAQASLRDAEVGVEQAELQLSYTRIVAPQAGWVTQRAVAIGAFVNPAQALMAIVPRSTWVTANFKETQLTGMKVGMPVDIVVDAYPSITFHGKVQSFQAGTGSAFSSLPAENATGNYVKVVQRVPVKIVFDDAQIADYRLSPGMSVAPTIKVR